MNLLAELPPLTWALVACAVAVGWALSWLWRWYLKRSARKALVAAITSVALDHLIDVLVPDGMGSSYHVDFLLLTTRGVVVIDLRDVGGNVFGGDQMNEWTVMDGAHRFTFVNPPRALPQGPAEVDAHARFTAHGVPAGGPVYACERHGPLRRELGAHQALDLAELARSAPARCGDVKPS